MFVCFVGQCSKLRDHIAKVRDVLINKDEQSPETIRTATSELQQASLKLFEVAYKKVWDSFADSVCERSWMSVAQLIVIGILSDIHA